MKTKVRKKKEVEEILQERHEKFEQKQKEREAWHRFWEKDSDVNYKKLKKGGFRKPKTFRYEEEDESEGSK